MKTIRSMIRVGFRASLIVFGAIVIAGCPAKPQQKESPHPQSNAPAAPAVEDESVDGGSLPGRVYTVEPKDTLFHIAEKYYGDRNQWRKIWQANKKRLPNPNDVPVGMKLIIP